VGEQLAAVRARVMAAAALERHSLVLDLNAGTGLLLWEAVRRAPVGGVWALAADERTGDALRQQAANLDSLARPVIMVGVLDELPDLIAAWGQGEIRFDAVIGRNALTQHLDKRAAAMLVASLLAEGGRLALAEVVPRHAQRLYRLVNLSELGAALGERLIAAEEAIYADPDDPMVSWDVADVQAAFQAAGLDAVAVQVESPTTQQHVSAEQLARWFDASADRRRPTYAQRLRQHLSSDELAQVQALFERQLRNQAVSWTSQVVYLSAYKRNA
jgi:putative ATPase